MAVAAAADRDGAAEVRGDGAVDRRVVRPLVLVFIRVSRFSHAPTLPNPAENFRHICRHFPGCVWEYSGMNSIKGSPQDIPVLETVTAAIEKYRVCLSQENKKWLERIANPPGFSHSMPGTFSDTATDPDGETGWQRHLFNTESRWLDLERVVGQRKTEKGWSPTRLDLIGFENGRYILCEVKKNKDGQSFDDLLQLLAYRAAMRKNARLLDENNVHHENARAKFSWLDVSANAVLMLKAPPEYWEKWKRSPQTPKNTAAKEIVENLGRLGLDIRFELEKE
jgi:hypothetical protein